MKIVWAVVAAIVALVVVGGIVKLTRPSTYDQCVNGLTAQGKIYLEGGNDTLPPVCLQLSHAQQNQAIKQAVRKAEQEVEQ